MERVDVVVTGAGVGGLMTACLLAEAGREVVVLEQATRPGGRARSTVDDGFVFNLGPHALYRGVARTTLAGLGLPLRGGRPPSAGALWTGAGFHALPGDPWTFATTGALDLGGRVAVGRRLLALVGGVRPRADQTVDDWCADLPADAAALLRALVRVATYTHAPDRQRADVAARQVAAALGGVDYLDGGWQSLVDGLLAAAAARGVRVRAGVEVAGRTPEGVRLGDGSELHAADVVLAVPPATCRRLGVDVPLRTPVRAACLDLGLDAATTPPHPFVLGLAEPVYLSVHSRVAKVAAEGHTVHVARYLAPGEDGAAALPGLEALLDAAWPGWRSHERARRWAPSLPVAWDLRAVGEAPVPVEAGPGTWLVGDWVGDEGLLLDASVASARRVAERVGARRGRAAA